MSVRCATHLVVRPGWAPARPGLAGALRLGGVAQRGFTLIELLLVMTLMGLATMMAVGGLDKFALRARDQSWVDKVRVELVRQRNRAILSGQPARADVVFATGELRAAGDDAGKPRLRLPDQFAFLPAGLAEGLSDLSSEQSMPIDFYPDGAASEASFLLRDPDGKLTRFHVRGLTGKISSGSTLTAALTNNVGAAGIAGAYSSPDSYAAATAMPPPYTAPPASNNPPAPAGGAFGFGASPGPGPADNGAPH